MFHDELARGLSSADLVPEAPGPLEAALLREADIRPGTRVLELGCGPGGFTLTLLAIGADVTAVDLSSEMIEVARRRIAQFGSGRTASLVAAPVERMCLNSGSFDVVVGRFILHHLDISEAAPEIARVLRRGGKAVFAENSARNALLMLARDHVAGHFGVPRLGTADERPISDSDIALLEPHFSSVEVSFPVFEFFKIFDRQVLRFRSRGASRVCDGLDRTAARIPALRQYSFRTVVTLEL
jgi:SAM-dependent methyltransferase